MKPSEVLGKFRDCINDCEEAIIAIVKEKKEIEFEFKYSVISIQDMLYHIESVRLDKETDNGIMFTTKEGDDLYLDDIITGCYGDVLECIFFSIE